MEFDEYEYLEKMVENPDSSKDGAATGNEEQQVIDRDGRDSRRIFNRSKERVHGRDRAAKRGRGEEGERRASDRGEKGKVSRVYVHREKHSRERDKEREHEGRAERGRRDTERGERDERVRPIEKDDKDSRSSDRDGTREKERERGINPRKSMESDRNFGKENDHDKERVQEKEASEGRGTDSRLEIIREYKHRHSRQNRDKKEESGRTEPEADPERDQRTVFAYQISLKADERNVYEFFSRAGKVRDVRIIMDRNSRRSKGFGYIEFYDAMCVPMAIAMSGQLLLGQPIMVKPSEAEKNLVQSTSTADDAAGGFNGSSTGGAKRLYVGNLHFNITEDQLRQVFEPFGTVELVQLPTNPETGQCKGFGFVQYQKIEDARAAQQALNGVLELVGRPIKVSAVSDHYGMQDMGITPGDLDDDDGGGWSLNARSRALLMQKLDRSGTTGAFGAVVSTAMAAPLMGLPGSGIAGTTPAMAPYATTLSLGLGSLPGMPLGGLDSSMVPIGVASEYLQLENMFDPKTETELEFDLDIKDDVQEECSKFGVVKHIFVDKKSAGHVYLCFDSVTAAMNAQHALHGRWFAGKMITATFMTALAYHTRFPESI
ncbi:hypothetical protein O6H91_05G068300 [Diphasiastrum complanatum]|uniref:Uncharacterized protein n=1 Tax=Diphasiastrum complanatum TaxID=34168 RepID=A0ACC2DP53_DIPCM|nr:hypothetical protein O6H91_05G068300 [Diphasiastrum complanatum]